jgi:hypothetical protein
MIEVRGIHIDVRNFIKAGIIDKKTTQKRFLCGDIMRKLVLVFLCHFLELRRT